MPAGGRITRNKYYVLPTREQFYLDGRETTDPEAPIDFRDAPRSRCWKIAKQWAIFIFLNMVAVVPFILSLIAPQKYLIAQVNFWVRIAFIIMTATNFWWFRGIKGLMWGNLCLFILICWSIYSSWYIMSYYYHHENDDDTFTIDDHMRGTHAVYYEHHYIRNIYVDNGLTLIYFIISICMNCHLTFVK